MNPQVLILAYGVLVALAMYGFVYIPTKKKQKKMQTLHDSVGVNDVVVTIGGIVGRVVSREEDYVVLMIDEEKETTVKVVLYAVGQIKEKAVQKN